MEAKMWTQRKKTEKATNKTEGPRNRSMEGIQGYIISLEKRREKESEPESNQRYTTSTAIKSWSVWALCVC